MERKVGKQQRTIGALIKIPLKGGYHTYGRILKDDIAFYDIRIKEDIAIEEIVKQPILFITTVYDDAIKKGYWEKISKAIALEDNLIECPPKYTQDVLNPNKYSIVYPDRQVEATKEQCIGLEFWSVWTHADIEKRLNDHFANTANPYVERMKRAEMYPTS